MPDIRFEIAYDFTDAHARRRKKVKRSRTPVSRVLYDDESSLPVIYLGRRSPVGSSVLPSIGMSRAGNPQTMVYANLQLPAGTA